jgi:hypothetical protein
MNDRYCIGWLRDHAGRVTDRPRRTTAHTITTFAGGGVKDADGLANTAMHIVFEYT